MTQNGPGTAPGSQGVFGAKSVGSKMGARQLLEQVLSCPVAGTSAQFLFVGEFKQMSFEIKRFVYSISKLLTT
jgi:hypothetical protein